MVFVPTYALSRTAFVATIDLRRAPVCTLGGRPGVDGMPRGLSVNRPLIHPATAMAAPVTPSFADATRAALIDGNREKSTVTFVPLRIFLERDGL